VLGINPNHAAIDGQRPDASLPSQRVGSPLPPAGRKREKILEHVTAILTMTETLRSIPEEALKAADQLPG
jgi:hypothetical protein